MSSTELVTDATTEVAVSPDTDTTPTVEQWVVPRIDVLEHEGDLKVLVDVPGATAEGLTLEVREGILQLDAVRADRPTRGYRRRLTLPDTVDTQAIAAHLAHGVLSLDLPAAEAAKPRRIQVSVD